MQSVTSAISCDSPFISHNRHISKNSRGTDPGFFDGILEVPEEAYFVENHEKSVSFRSEVKSAFQSEYQSPSPLTMRTPIRTPERHMRGSRTKKTPNRLPLQTVAEEPTFADKATQFTHHRNSGDRER